MDRDGDGMIDWPEFRSFVLEDLAEVADKAEASHAILKAPTFSDLPSSS